MVYIGAENFALFVQEEDDAVEFRRIAHDLEMTRPFCGREFLVT